MANFLQFIKFRAAVREYAYVREKVSSGSNAISRWNEPPKAPRTRTDATLNVSEWKSPGSNYNIR